MALRPRLSTGLLFRMLFVHIITRTYKFLPFIFVISAYRIATPALLFWQGDNKQSSPAHITLRLYTGLENQAISPHISSIEHFPGC